MIDLWRPPRLPSPLLAALPLLGMLIAGCNGGHGIGVRGKPVPPRDAHQAMERINANLEKIDGALYCPGLTSFRFRDANGRDRRFLWHDATVIFEAPRCLYFDIKHTLGGSVARIASNDEQYWLWIDTPETRKLWHGSWDVLEAGGARALAVPPRQLLEETPDRLAIERLRLLSDRLRAVGLPRTDREGLVRRPAFGAVVPALVAIGRLEQVGLNRVSSSELATTRRARLAWSRHLPLITHASTLLCRAVGSIIAPRRQTASPPARQGARGCMTESGGRVRTTVPPEQSPKRKRGMMEQSARRVLKHAIRRVTHPWCG